MENKGGLPLPIYLTIFLDGYPSVLHYSAVWIDGKKELTFTVKMPAGKIEKIEFGNDFIPDKFKADNVWNRK